MRSKELIEIDSKHHKKLMDRLREVGNLTGLMRLSDSASKHYRSWYEQLFNSDMEDKTGTIDRLGDQVLKVAMLISASEQNDLIIAERQLAKAIEESEKCLMGTRAISMEKTKGDINPIIEKVLKELIRSPEQEITRKKLMIATHIEAMLLDRALDTLVQRGAIHEPKRNSKKEIYYKMTKDTYKTYMKFKVSESLN